MLTILVVIVFSATITRAQDSYESSATPRRLTLAVYVGFTAGGPAKGIESLMINSGFDDKERQFFGTAGGQTHPYSLTGINFQSGAPWMVSMQYVFKRPFVVGILLSQTKIGTTFGFRAEPSLDVNIRYSMNAIAMPIGLQVTDFFHFGIGPALYMPKTGTTSLSTIDQGQIANKMGLLLEFGAVFPSKSPFFLELRVQYHNAGQVRIGPFLKEGVKDRTLPATDVSYNHLLYSLGFGIALVR